MNRLFILSIAVWLSVTAFGQETTGKLSPGTQSLRKIENITYGVKDLNSLPEKSWEEIQEHVEKAVNDPQTATNYKTWEWMITVLNHDRTLLLNAHKANGDKFKNDEEMMNFFDNEETIVMASETYYKLLTTPNANGKLPVKDNELPRLKSWALAYATPCRSNIYVGATQLLHSSPEIAAEWLKTYLDSFHNPLFDGVEDNNQQEAGYIYAKALMATNGDKSTIERFLKNSLTLSNGALACQDLITFYEKEGNKEGRKKYLLYGYEHYPQHIVFGLNLAQTTLQEGDNNETLSVCTQLIKRIKEGSVSPENKDAEWYVYYLRAASLFNLNEYAQAYDAFLQADKAYPGHSELLIGAGSAAAKNGNEHASDTSLSKEWWQKAVDCLSIAERQWPDKSAEWGYQLYACYHNLRNKAMEEKYKKYATR